VKDVLVPILSVVVLEFVESVVEDELVSAPSVVEVVLVEFKLISELTMVSVSSFIEKPLKTFAVFALELAANVVYPVPENTIEPASNIANTFENNFFIFIPPVFGCVNNY
jgi:hypothetical protein